jgi:hypothetical protein
MPIWSGVLRYFPDAIAAVARISKLGNDKHNPGEPLHWARGKSMDQEDCCTRHLLELGTIDTDDGALHDAKLAWRALANLQLVIEERTAKGLPVFDEEIIAENNRKMAEKLKAGEKWPAPSNVLTEADKVLAKYRKLDEERQAMIPPKPEPLKEVDRGVY